MVEQQVRYITCGDCVCLKICNTPPPPPPAPLLPPPPEDNVQQRVGLLCVPEQYRYSYSQH